MSHDQGTQQSIETSHEMTLSLVSDKDFKAVINIVNKVKENMVIMSEQKENSNRGNKSINIFWN